MGKLNWGPVAQGQVRTFLEVFLTRAEQLDFDKDFHWEEDATRPRLAIKTKRRFIQQQTKLQQDAFFNVIKCLKILKILEDRRGDRTQGADEWFFALRLWSKDKAKNLYQFHKVWESDKPTKSKNQVIGPTEFEGRVGASEIDTNWSELFYNHLEAERWTKSCTEQPNGLEYFSYVSKSKVEQLYSQIPEIEVQLVEALLTDKLNKLGNLDVSVLKLLLNGATFGQKERTLSQSQSAKSLIQKLRQTLKYVLYKKTIGDLNSLGDSRKISDAFCYAYEGKFRVNPNKGSEEIAIIESSLLDVTLELACSFKNFSDMGISLKDGVAIFQPHSGNFHFFKGQIECNFKTHFFITACENKRIFGSPIYLILRAVKGLYL